MSMKCITRPPNMLPNAFASFGSTASTISDIEALTGLPGSCDIGLSSFASFGFVSLGIREMFSDFAYARRLASVSILAIIPASNP